LESPIAEDEFERLMGIISGFDGTAGAQLSNEYTSQMIARQWFCMARIRMSLTLWQVLHDITPYFDDVVAFNLRSGETPIWQTGSSTVTYAEERTVSDHTRSFGSISMPIGGGMYYRIGSSHANYTSGLLPLDVGQVLITSHTLYFGGPKKTLKIPLDRVIRYQSYLDGVGVCESHGAPKVFVFNYSGMDAGWFFYNLVSALTNRSDAR
jgi:hypothetical protein